MAFERNAINRRFDRRVEEFHDQHEQHRARQDESLESRHWQEYGDGREHQQGGQFLSNGRLAFVGGAKARP
jgi:hypothetical protein